MAYLCNWFCDESHINKSRPFYLIDFGNALLMEANDLKISESTMSKSATGIDYVWRAYGKPEDHQAAMIALIARDDVKEFSVV